MGWVLVRAYRQYSFADLLYVRTFCTIFYVLKIFVRCTCKLLFFFSFSAHVFAIIGNFDIQPPTDGHHSCCKMRRDAICWRCLYVHSAITDLIVLYKKENNNKKTTWNSFFSYCWSQLAGDFNPFVHRRTPSHICQWQMKSKNTKKVWALLDWMLLMKARR